MADIPLARVRYFHGSGRSFIRVARCPLCDRAHEIELMGVGLNGLLGGASIECPADEFFPQRTFAVLSVLSVSKHREPQSGEVIYFLSQRSLRSIKIGFTTNLSRRLATLRTSSDESLDLLAAMPGVRADERFAHARFRHLRLHGEWFSPSDELLEFISKVRSEFPQPREVIASLPAAELPA